MTLEEEFTLENFLSWLAWDHPVVKVFPYSSSNVVEECPIACYLKYLSGDPYVTVGTTCAKVHGKFTDIPDWAQRVARYTTGKIIWVTRNGIRNAALGA